MNDATVTLDLVDITTLDRSQAMKVLCIRNEQAVRHNMYTDHEIQREEHLGWVDRLRGSKDAIFFAVFHGGEVVGGASLSAINRLHKRADWAFYLSASTQGKGIGSTLERQFVTMAFNKYGLEKLNCEVISFNERVARMHQRFGFVIEGTRRDHVIRDGKKFDVILLGITRDEWENRLNSV